MVDIGRISIGSENEFQEDFLVVIDDDFDKNADLLDELVKNYDSIEEVFDFINEHFKVVKLSFDKYYEV